MGKSENVQNICKIMNRVANRQKIENISWIWLWFCVVLNLSTNPNFSWKNVRTNFYYFYKKRCKTILLQNPALCIVGALNCICEKVWPTVSSVPLIKPSKIIPFLHTSMISVNNYLYVQEGVAKDKSVATPFIWGNLYNCT